MNISTFGNFAALVDNEMACLFVKELAKQNPTLPISVVCPIYNRAILKYMNDLIEGGPNNLEVIAALPENPNIFDQYDTVYSECGAGTAGRAYYFNLLLQANVTIIAEDKPDNHKAIRRLGHKFDEQEDFLILRAKFHGLD